MNTARKLNYNTLRMIFNKPERNMKEKAKLFKTKKIIIICIAVIILFVIQYIHNDSTAYYKPDYPMEDISYIIDKDKLTDDDLDGIFKNTGVSPEAARELIGNNGKNTLKTLNKLYFGNLSFDKSYIAFPVTANELNNEALTPLVPLKKGDVLVTFNTHTLSWRHGHSAIVVDDSGDVILEHMSVGHKSKLTLSKRWGIYPGFLVLRHKDSEISSKAADYAKKELTGIDYNIFADFSDSHHKADSVSDSSHCAHIVWKAYSHVGCDIDGDGGTIVTPYDISVCNDFYVVQIFGINPENYKDRIAK